MNKLLADHNGSARQIYKGLCTHIYTSLRLAPERPCARRACPSRLMQLLQISGSDGLVNFTLRLQRSVDPAGSHD